MVCGGFSSVLFCGLFFFFPQIWLSLVEYLQSVLLFQFCSAKTVEQLDTFSVSRYMQIL